MNILFCNIAWMKYYQGVNESDKPKNGGAYIKENENGGECSNFRDYNGKCYGYFMLYGDMALESHFKAARKHQGFLKDVLVIWVATNEKNETRIVGWYKNATVYSQEQFIGSFTDEENNLYYRADSLAKDCYLLPEKERTFPIQRAAQTGKGTGVGRANVWYAESPFARTVLIPKVLEYINNYEGKFVNLVISEDMLNAVLKNDNVITDFQKLVDEGKRFFESKDYLEALKFFNTARSIKEDEDVLFHIADSLLSLKRFDKAIPLFEKVIELEGEKVDSVYKLISAYGSTGDTGKTIEYCNRILCLLDDSKEGIDDKIWICCVMFDIYILLKDEIHARTVINEISTYSADDAQISAKKMQEILNGEFAK